MQVYVIVQICFLDIFQFVGSIKAHDLSFWLIWLQNIFNATQLEIKGSKLQFYSCDMMHWWYAHEMQMSLNGSCKMGCLHLFWQSNGLNLKIKNKK